MIKYIAHRGNINGPSTKENHPDQIVECIRKGYDVEIDIRYINYNIHLGHDEPTYKIDSFFLEKYSNFLWIHCKDLSSLHFCLSQKNSLNFFWHDKDCHTLTSKKIIWSYPGQPITKRSICVLPEQVDNINIDSEFNGYGICSDYIKNFYDLTRPKNRLL
jgi:hypothetical protein